MEQLDPKIYFSLFQINNDGAKVLEELCRRFYDKPSYVRGDTHETAFNEGAKSAIHFILNRIAQAQQKDNGEQSND